MVLQEADEKRGGRMPEALQFGLGRSPQAPGEARETIRDWSAALGFAKEVEDTLRLLISELVTNAVEHSRAAPEAPIEVVAEHVVRIVPGHGTERRITVAVSDHGEWEGPPPAERYRGLGLQLVDEVSEHWGIEHRPGTRVWFELLHPEHS